MGKTTFNCKIKGDSKNLV